MSYSNVKVNTSLITKAYRNEFLSWLGSMPELRTIVWDKTLCQTFDLFVDTASIKGGKMMYLDDERPEECRTPNILLIVRPEIPTMEKVARFISRVTRDEKSTETNKKNFHVLFVPRRSLLCEKKLKDMEVLNHIKSIEELAADIFPLDTDVLSMDMGKSFRECHLEDKLGSLYHVAKSLMFVQSLFGTIPNVIGKGDMANRVVDIMLRMKREMQPHEPNVPPRIDNLLLIDRAVDPITPLMTQLTYEGLIDEQFGITKGSVALPAEKFSANQTSEPSSNPFESSTVAEEIKKIPLNSSDELFADLRDRNFNAVGSFLGQRVKLLRVEADERHTAKSVREMRQFTSKLPHIIDAKAALNTHTTIAHMINEVVNEDEFRQWVFEQHEYLEVHDIDKSRSLIEDAILRDEPIVKVLRLMCLQCLCNDGFKPKLMDHYMKEIIQNYGYHHIITLCNLEKVGLLKVQGQAKTFQTICRLFKLLVRGTNEQKPEDISYVYSIYAPLSVRIAQLYNKLNWRGIADSVNDILPGKVRTETQSVPSWLQKREDLDDSVVPCSLEQKVTLVFFIGGVTYAEISALRFLSHMDDSSPLYIVGTTNITNGSSWLESLFENIKQESNNPFL